MYLPIPEGVSARITSSIPGPVIECNTPAPTATATVTFNVPKSTVTREKRVDITLNEIYRPISGCWKSIKESGSIKMTPMSIKKEKLTYFVSGAQIPYFSWKIYGHGYHSAKVNGICKACVRNVYQDTRILKVSGRYVEQGDLDYWKSKYPDAPHIRAIGYWDDNKIEAQKAAAYSELFQAFNLGEEIAELRETIGMITNMIRKAVPLIMSARKQIDSLLSQAKPKEASKRWMEFRYGIMPIIYSIQDIVALKGETGLYRTIRKSVLPEEDFDEPPLNGPYFEDVGSTLMKCSITAKARWASQELKQLDLININPITTAFDIYPWSMVVRWFFNVSTFMTTRIKSLTSMSLEHHACVAIREKTECGTYLNFTSGYYHHITHAGDSSLCGKGFFNSTDFGIFSDSVPNRLLLSWLSKDNYTRYLYQPQDVKLVFSPYIDWRRAIDGLILGWGQASKLLRRLK